jgi:hypothetical protein
VRRLRFLHPATQAPALFVAILALATSGLATVPHGPDRSTLKGDASASLTRGGKHLYLHAGSHTFELAQFVDRGAVRTVVVEGAVAHKLLVNDDIGANGDQTGQVTLVIHPIDSHGLFAAPLASRAMAGDQIKLDSPSGVKVITWGCCAESNAINQLNLATLKTMYVQSDGAPLSTYTILGKPAKGRLIALYLTLTPEDHDVLGKEPSAVGMITLVDDDDTLQRIRVHLAGKDARNNAMNWSLEAGWKGTSATLDNHTVIDPAKPSTPIYEWKIDDTNAIELPLRSDRLDVSAAKLPPGVTLESLAP